MRRLRTGPMVARPGEGRPETPADPSGRAVLARIILLAAAVRLGLQAVGLATLRSMGEPVWANGLRLWSKWDAPHYLRLARVGYRSTGEDSLYIVFFPIYPAVVRIFSLVFRNLVLSGMVVSFAASVGAGWLLYRIVRLDAGHDEAWRAVLLLFAFPTAYYLAAPYTEALFLCVVLAAVWCARTGDWPRAGLAGALATGTRVTGLALLPALVAQWFERRRTDPPARLIWVVLAGAGAAGYLAVNLVVFRDPFHFLSVQSSHWNQGAVPPWQSLVDAVLGRGRIAGRPEFAIIFGGRLAAAGFAIAVLAFGARRLRAADQVYAWSGLVLVMSVSWLISLPRYLLVIYPLFIALARWTKNELLFAALLAGGFAAQAWFFTIYVRGGWTF